jgi:hypothetical protein
MKGCQRLKQYLRQQMEDLQHDDHFLKHKWYRSEEACRDIGLGGAIQSFAQLPYYRSFAMEFREKYCSEMCDKRFECSLWKREQRSNKKMKEPVHRAVCL